MRQDNNGRKIARHIDKLERGLEALLVAPSR
jgi:hypothetical protein